MTGLLFFRPPDESYRKHTHLILSLKGGQEPELQYWNARRFGRIFLLDEGAFKAFISRRFGYDPLTVSRQEFLNLIKGRRGRVKTLLMHQQAIAGIGNIYANEILFRARIHPYRVASRLQVATVQRLYDVMQEVLRQAILDGGSSVRDFFAPDWSKGQYKRCHLVYNRAGLPCAYGCGHNIRRMNGERSSFFCPACQRR
jgi:formamidopyrimidine-DNA glycosylase